MIRALLLFGALLATVTEAAHATPPAHVEIRYEIVTGSIKLGEGREVLQHDDNQYRVTSESTPTGIAALFISDVHRSSSGQINAGGLQPELFEEEGRKGGQRQARFDWSDHRLTTIYGDEKSVIELPPGTQDQASFPFSFAFAPPKADRFTAHITDGKNLKEYIYRLVGRETLKTPIGEIATLHFEKVKEGDDKRGFEFWLAVDRHYLPVKLRYTEKDGRPFDSNVIDLRYQ